MASPGLEDDPLAGHPGALRPLTGELVAAVLAARGRPVGRAGNGDLVGRFDDNLIWFLRLGADGELLQVRTMVAPTFGIEQVPTAVRLLQLLEPRPALAEGIRARRRRRSGPDLR